MPLDWKQPEMTERLLAALIAAGDGKVDYKRVAHYFGQGATYDTIFNRFRNAIKASKELIKEAEARGGAPPARSKTSNSNPATPRRGLAATISASKKRSQPSDDDEPESPTKKAKKSRGKTAKSVEKEVEKDEPVVEEPVVEEESVVKEEMIDEEDIDAEDKVEVEA